MRFVQHYPVEDAQPKYGYKPLGGLCWFGTNGTAADQLRPQLCHGMGGEIDYPGVPVFTNQWQRIKAKCETIHDEPSTNTTRYSFKTWKDGDPEPVSWTFSTEVTDIKNGSATGLRNGSLGLISYMADVTFGNVTIKPAGIDQNVIAIHPAARYTNPSAQSSPSPAYACFINNERHAHYPSLTGLIFNPAGRVQYRAGVSRLAQGMWIIKNADLDH